MLYIYVYICNVYVILTVFFRFILAQHGKRRVLVVALLHSIRASSVSENRVLCCPPAGMAILSQLVCTLSANEYQHDIHGLGFTVLGLVLGFTVGFRVYIGFRV